MTGKLRVLGVSALLAMTACSATPAGETQPTASPSAQAPPAAGGANMPVLSRYTKVLVIPEENKQYGRIIGAADAPYVNKLAATYGTAKNMGAGYAVKCPSLAAYILLTSGTTHGICDDNDAVKHQLTGDNVFAQVAKAGKQYRQYAESMPTNCRRTNTGNGVYVVRHAVPPYYATENSSGRCAKWDVPLGTVTSGNLHNDITKGTLPALSWVTPDTCHDMHGAGSCEASLVKNGDTWLSTWLPKIMAGPDYKSGKLAVFVVWDEGNATDNHIPALVISPSTAKVASSAHLTHCSVLRTVEEILGLSLLNCAASASPMRQEFKLA
ncbi:MAG: phosphoesterase [Actinomycetia bacterium]|nr:phosphoesterase [Actinomycetes bacterium]